MKKKTEAGLLDCSLRRIADVLITTESGFKNGSSYVLVAGWFMTVVPAPFSRERAQQMMLGQLVTHMQENEVVPILHHIKKLTQNGLKT